MDRSYMFKVEHLSKEFGSPKGRDRIEVVRDISMTIAEKEFIVILGPSGCGKSTFLKMLAGIQSATSGNISVNGVDYGREITKDALRKFGFVFQNNNLLQWRTAEGNLRFMLEIMKLKGDKWNDRVDEMLKIVGLQDYKRVYPHELSGGMRQRVGIARALVHDPDIIVMDQPLGALDAITRKMLAYELLNIWKETQKTVIMVTNNVDEAVLLASRVFVFSELPASILNEVKIDIPVEQRDSTIEQLPRYNELREQVNAIVRSTM